MAGPAQTIFDTRSATESQAEGLGNAPRRQWPAIQRGEPIDILAPGTDAHARVIQYLLARLEASEFEMTNFYPRWRALEKQIQAYIDLEDWDKKLQEMNDKGRPPKVVDIIIPFSYATITTITTFLLHTFTGRKPMFQIGSYKDENINPARNMELLLQYNSDHTHLIKHLWNFFQDCMTYGVGILRSQFVEEFVNRTVRDSVDQVDSFGNPTGLQDTETRKEKRVSYEGNRVFSQDPFMFFPDPRVPMSEVAQRGEYVFWRTFDGRHQLLKQQFQGVYKYVNQIPRTGATLSPSSSDAAGNRRVAGGSADSSRSLAAGGHSFPGFQARTGVIGQEYIQVDQGTVEIIPRELGLGDSEEPEKWQFTIGNKKQIIQAVPFAHDHDQHPVSVSEPLSMGYGFGHLGMADYMQPLQNSISWLFNSHMGNVKRVLNDVLVVDPNMIEMQDLKDMSEGAIIRLKQAAFGQDVRSVLQQLPIQDVTRAHISDMETMFDIATLVSGISENLLGAQDTGGRKTATEVRTSTEAGASRLSALTRIISAQAIAPGLTQQMSMNLQQFLSDDFYVQVLGEEGKKDPIKRGDVVGDFNFPVHDGTLPLDRVALVEVWQQVFAAILQDEQLRQSYSVPKVFEFIAELGGARNIESMRLTTRPDSQILDGLNGGQIAPTSEVPAR